MVSANLLGRTRGRLALLVASALTLSTVAWLPATQAYAATAQYLVSVTPSTVDVVTASNTTSPPLYSVSVTDQISNGIGTVQVAVPPGITVKSLVSAGVGTTKWTLSLLTCTPTSPAPCSAGLSVLQATGGKNRVSQGQALAITFTAVAQQTLRSYQWNTGATTSPNNTGLSFVPPSPPPTTSVVAGPADHFVVTAPTTATAGQAITPVTVTAYDHYGNLATKYNGAATLSCTGVTTGTGPMGSCPSPLAGFTNGSASTTVTLDQAGPQTISATDGSITTPTPASVTVSSASATLLTLTGPTAPSAGTSLSLAVMAQDPFGNIATGYSGSVAFVCSAPVNTPTSNTGLCPASTSVTGGHATVPAQLDAAVNQMITASSGTLTNGVYSVTVAPGAPTKITITSITDTSTSPALSQPVVTKPFNTAVQFFDAYGNLAPLSANTTLTTTLTAGTGTLTPGSVTLSAGSTGGTIPGSVYSKVENNIGLLVSGGSLTPGSITTNVATQVASVSGLSPGTTSTTLTSVDPTTGSTCVLGPTNPTCSQLVLGSGALESNAYLYEGTCVNVTGPATATCQTGGSFPALLVYGLAALQQTGSFAYTANNPAKLLVSCYRAVCPHPDQEGFGGSGDEGSRGELQEMVTAYPLTVTVNTSPTTTVTADATICANPGVVDAGKYFCIDPSLSGTDASGNYIQVLDFYGDILAHNR